MNLGRADEARRLTDLFLAAVHSPITARPDPLVLHEMVSAIADLSRLSGGGKEPTEHLRNLHHCAHAMPAAGLLTLSSYTTPWGHDPVMPTWAEVEHVKCAQGAAVLRACVPSLLPVRDRRRRMDLG
jgi:hypothetical protein